jgi:hypothetical protein
VATSTHVCRVLWHMAKGEFVVCLVFSARQTCVRAHMQPHTTQAVFHESVVCGCMWARTQVCHVPCLRHTTKVEFAVLGVFPFEVIYEI